MRRRVTETDTRPRVEPASVPAVAEREVAISNRLGLHARAAARFVKTASRFDAVVTVTCGTTTSDGKSILGLLFLAARTGCRIRIRATGPDADAALDALTRLVRNGFGEIANTTEAP